MRRLALALTLVLAACGGTTESTISPAASSTSVVTTPPDSVADSPGTIPWASSTVTGPGRSTSTTDVAGCADKRDKGTLTVLAASSMVNVFDSARRRFLVEHPCVTALNISYGSSATLAAQIIAGSPADVFVSASDATMSTVTSDGLAVLVPVVFARNNGAVMISHASSFRDKVSGLADLLDSANPGIKTGLCVASAPCGSLADRILKAGNAALSRTDLTRSRVADTETSSVEDLVSKVEIGELDAGVVYASDCLYATNHGLASCVPIPAGINQSNNYLAAGLNRRRNTSDFVKWTTSSSFAELLVNEYGFLAP